MNENKNSFWIEVFKFAIIVVFFVIPFRLYIAKPFIVSGSSMSPTFENGNYLIIDQLSYHFSQPERGDVIVFKYPKDPEKFFIKRIVGLPKDTVEIARGKVLIKNSANPEGFSWPENYVNENNVSTENLKISLDDGEYFVLGDNRINSSDSRSWGVLNEKLIIGKPFLRLFPLKNISFSPGNFKLLAN